MYHTWIVTATQTVAIVSQMVVTVTRTIVMAAFSWYPSNIRFCFGDSARSSQVDQVA